MSFLDTYALPAAAKLSQISRAAAPAPAPHMHTQPCPHTVYPDAMLSWQLTTSQCIQGASVLATLPSPFCRRGASGLNIRNMYLRQVTVSKSRDAMRAASNHAQYLLAGAVSQLTRGAVSMNLSPFSYIVAEPLTR